jgi:ion channel-forming bestrophin family protein
MTTWILRMTGVDNTEAVMDQPRRFWSEVFTLRNSVTPSIKWRIAIFGAVAAAVWLIGTYTGMIPTSEIAPYELIGVTLAVLLMIRTNSGYDRWYEGRKLWGGIVNQSRNLAQIGIVYGPQEREWRDEFVRWVSAFPHTCRHSLRGETDVDDMQAVLDERQLETLKRAQHMPLYVAKRLARMLQNALDNGQLDHFAFLEAEHQRTQLIDHIGACERILKTPLAESLSVKIRRFLFLYLMALPFGIFDKAGIATPIIVMLVAYPLLSLDQISVELQNPFSKRRLSHLPLDEICASIQRNVLALSDAEAADEDSEISEAPQRHSKVAV